ncbi:hypothetical protein [Streptomyces sp. NPDC088725]|uniref:hypothetical protein n=1 Tax=Streptomyces sp. NPDC088725 TaxID=3365873 RepID=UPI0037F9012C
MTEQLTPEAPAPEPAPAVASAAPSASAVPPMPSHAPQAAPLAPAPAALSRPPRRALRAVARWTAAVLVCGGLGTGAALGISGMERTDVPGLATRDDGRWDYPELSLPALPAGSPRPFSDANTAQIHHADLRRLVLPAPAGATADKKLTGGWAGADTYLSEYAPDKRDGLRAGLRDLAVRDIAARGWTMADGTVARVYLLRFGSVAFAQEYAERHISAVLNASAAPLAAAPATELDPGWPRARTVDGVKQTVFVEPEPYGPTQVRQAYLMAGDTLALVVTEKKGGAPAVPFHQTVILQSQLLG